VWPHKNFLTMVSSLLGSNSKCEWRLLDRTQRNSLGEMKIRKRVCTTLMLALLAIATVAAGPFRYSQSGFEANHNGLPAGWRVWSARAEIAPRTFVDHAQSRAQPGSLAISGNGNPAAYGGWEY